jgi:hypothetical protein
MAHVSDLIGKTMVSVTRGEYMDSDALTFTTDDGARYRLFHAQSCCESVTIEDIAGDLEDLVGSPLVMAEEVSGVPPFPRLATLPEQESETWTFYKFATVKGYVTVRWYGTSNGYYSESVDFIGPLLNL